MSEAMAGDRTWATQDLGYDYETNEKYGFGSSATPEGTIIDRLGPTEMRLGMLSRMLDLIYGVRWEQ